MPEARIYSQRLGAISDAQFQAIASRLNLGRFVKAEPTASGLFGQNVFVTTTTGEFVLRGAPHWVKATHETAWRQEDRWQFTKEKFFAAQLHERTNAPVPWPMQHDESNDILGWPYLVMPRMPGACFDERSILKALAPEHRHSVAVALGAMLAEVQQLTWPFAGDFGITSIALEPYAIGATRQVIDDTRTLVEMAAQHGTMTDDDRSWIDAAVAQALAVSGSRPHTFVHGDYKLNNLTVVQGGDGWRVSGLFDLHEARFGDGVLDIVRQSCSYLDTESELAAVFIDSYLERVVADARIKALLPLYVVNDRMKFWEFFTRPDARATWSNGRTFRGWAERYVDGLLSLVR
jgi:aminoglycoside phosphotransferase (APT) family kinase protein